MDLFRIEYEGMLYHVKGLIPGMSISDDLFKIAHSQIIDKIAARYD